jgi:cysteine-rich repeat protein
MPIRRLASRRSALGQAVALSAFVAVGSIGACADGDPEIVDGAGGSVGLGGTSGGGGVGGAAEGGQLAARGGSHSAGAGGEAGGPHAAGGHTGGVPATGGASGAGRAGAGGASAGSGGQAEGGNGGVRGAVCGDSQVQSSEQCDDGNAELADGCYLCKATAKCDSCWVQRDACALWSFPNPNRPNPKDPALLKSNDNVVTRCLRGDVAGTTGALVAPSGSLRAGATYSELCTSVLTCALENDCRFSASGPSLRDMLSYCWCGRTDGVLSGCDSATASGPCRQEIEAASLATSTTGLDILLASVSTNPDVPLGMAGLVLECRSDYCAADCLGGTP